MACQVKAVIKIVLTVAAMNGASGDAAAAAPHCARRRRRRWPSGGAGSDAPASWHRARHRRHGPARLGRQGQIVDGADRPIGGPGDPVHIVGSIVATEATISDDPAVAAMGRPRAPCSGLGASVVDARGPDQHEERGIWLADVKTDGAARKMTGGQRQGPIRSSHNAWAWAWLRCRRC